MRAKGVWIALAVLGSAAGVAAVRQMGQEPLSTGRRVSPTGNQTEVGSFPVNMTLSADGRYVIVTNCGFREQLSVLDATTGKLVSKLEFNKGKKGDKEQLYYGLATIRTADGQSMVAASRGGEDLVDLYTLSDAGELKLLRQLSVPNPENPLKLPAHVAGLAFSADGRQLYASLNQSHQANGFHGRLATLSVGGEAAPTTVEVGAFPLGVVRAGGDVFVANEGDETVSVAGGANVGTIKTGTAPGYLLTDRAGKTLYVTNSMSDTLSVVDVASRKVRKTMLLRPGNLRGLPGSTPLGMALSSDERTMYVAVADLGAVAVVDLKDGELEGFIPAGWYPTSVVVSPDGKRLFVANAKGVQVRNPNGKDVHGLGQYAPNIIEGTVAMVDLTSATTPTALKTGTATVLRNMRPGDTEVAAKNPGIEHVVYIVKENRTYDQVLGDLPQANGDPSLVLFGRDVTPNQHALVERFGLLDNFYVCAEVSADGWNWSTSGMGNAYTERNVPVNYSGRGRNYDFEGTNNGTAVDLEGRRDVATAAGGYLWDAAQKAGVSYRNYGMFVSFGDVAPNGNEAEEVEKADRATKRALTGKTCLDFRRFDTAYADGEAWVKYGLAPAPKQLTKFGSQKDPSRVTAWLREFNEQIRTKSFPRLTMLRLGRDHTAGTAVGQSSPRAMVADNDYAVAQVVDAVSHSPYWTKTAIFIVEDDAQAGFDHVDCHRSTGYVVSPFLKPGTRSSTFYNTDSVLRTMADLLGLKPWNEYIATARPMTGLFADKPVNADPFVATLPAKEIVAEVNSRNAYRATDSARLFNRYEEETAADFELNDILWRSIKGAHAPRPASPGVRWSAGPDRDDD